MILTAINAATQYRTGSGPGSPAGQPGWGGGSDRMLARTERYDLSFTPVASRIQSLLVRY